MQRNSSLSNLLIPALLSLLTISFLFCNVPLDAASVEFQAGTAAGWDFHDLDADIARNNTVDWDDLGVIAQHWLDADCGDPNQWCAGADIDGSTGVDFIDYALLTKDWSKQGASERICCKPFTEPHRIQQAISSTQRHSCIEQGQGMRNGLCRPTSYRLG